VREEGGVIYLHGGGASFPHERCAEHFVLEVLAEVHLLGADGVQHACLSLVVAGRRLQAQALTGGREVGEGEGEGGGRRGGRVSGVARPTVVYRYEGAAKERPHGP